MEGSVLVDRGTRQEAFDAAVAVHYPGLVRRLTAVIRDAEAAADLAQETYLRAYRAWDRFDGGDVRAWLHTIGLRLAFNERRRRQRWSALLHRAAPPSTRPDGGDEALHAALGGLRPEHRAALLLNVVDGYTQAEIAVILGVAPGTVASWLSRTKRHLREALRDG